MLDKKITYGGHFQSLPNQCQRNIEYLIELYESETRRDDLNRVIINYIADTIKSAIDQYKRNGYDTALIEQECCYTFYS